MNENLNIQTKKCKHCQSDIPKKAKVCPNCRKKQSGILKWFLIVFVVLVIIGSVGGNEDKPTKVSNNTNESTSSTASATTSETVAEETTFGVGDTAEYRGVKVTLNAVEESNGSQFNKPTDGNVFLLVNFTIENNTNSDLAISSMLCFDAYQDGYATNYSLTALLEKTGNQLDGTIAPGKKIQGYVGYEVPATYKEFEINYRADVWDDTKFTFIYKK